MSNKIEIQELREAGGDGGDLMGYYCRGHVDRWWFAKAANEYSGAEPFYDARHVKAEKVRHVWWRTVPLRGEPGCFAFHSAEPNAKGAWAATVCESVQDREVQITERRIREHRRAEAAGFCEGVNWALRILDFSHPEAREALLSAFRAKRPAEADAGLTNA